MKRVAVSIVLIANVMTAQLHGQVALRRRTPASRRRSGRKQWRKKAQILWRQDICSSATGLQSNEPTTTEIYADEAFLIQPRTWASLAVE